MRTSATENVSADLSPTPPPPEDDAPPTLFLGGDASVDQSIAFANSSEEGSVVISMPRSEMDTGLASVESVTGSRRGDITGYGLAESCVICRIHRPLTF